MHMFTPLASGPTADFYGWEVISYYWNNIENYFADYSWQVRTAYGIILWCIIIMIVLFALFTIFIIRRKRYERDYKKLEDQFRERFYNILIQPEELSVVELEEMVGCNLADLSKYDVTMFLQMISSIRMELSEVLYLPNMQQLCNVTAVKDYLEKCLAHHHHEFETLQMVVNLNLRLNEGELAVYINHRNSDIRLMARLSYIICAETEPYRYLEQDLNEPQAAWRPMLMHRLFGWIQSCERSMPNFLIFADTLQNAESAAFMIEETAYWGTEEEKEHISDFYLSEHYACRSAAFRATALLGGIEHEDEMVATWSRQPENIRRDLLKALLAINSGRQLDFFEQVYRSSASKETQEQALSCMYLYGQEGRRRFELIRNEDGGEHRLLLDQIDSINLIKQLQAFS